MTPISLTRLLMKRFILHPDFEKAGILNLLRSSIQLQAPNFEDQEKRSRIKKMFVLSKSFNDNSDFYKQTFGICDIFVNSYSFLYLRTWQLPPISYTVTFSANAKDSDVFITLCVCSFVTFARDIALITRGTNIR